jgi:hypothetical protein
MLPTEKSPAEGAAVDCAAGVAFAVGVACTVGGASAAGIASPVTCGAPANIKKQNKSNGNTAVAGSGFFILGGRMMIKFLSAFQFVKSGLDLVRL